MTEITAQLDGERNILLEIPPMANQRNICTSLLGDGVASPSVLFVTYTQQAIQCVEQIEGIDGIQNVGVITVGDAATAVDSAGVVTESISTPSDLTGLGIQIGQFLSEWESPVLVCFDSLTSMLQYVDFETAFEFLHAITGQIHAADARAHFHIDPGAHDQTDVAAIASLCDARISLGDEVNIQTRDIVQ